MKINTRILYNISWTLVERVIAIFANFILLVLLTRFSSKMDVGLFAYLMSMVGLLFASTHLGLNSIAVRNFRLEPDAVKKITAAVIVPKFAMLTIGVLLIFLVARNDFLETDALSAAFLLYLVSIFFSLSDVFEYWLQAHELTKKSAKVKLLITMIFLPIKMLATYWFGLPGLLLGYALKNIAVGLALAFLFKKQNSFSFISLRLNVHYMLRMLREGAYIYLGTLFSIIYLKIDQIMIKNMIGLDELAVYSIASSMSEALYFVPSLIAIVTYPSLIDKHKSSRPKYEAYLRSLLSHIHLLAVGVTLIFLLGGETLIRFAYGESFLRSSDILKIHVVATLLVFPRAIISKVIVIEKIYFLSLFSHVVGAIVNFLLNLWLIPIYAGEGAAYATLASYCFSCIFALTISSTGRWMIKQMLYAYWYMITLRFLKYDAV